MKLTGTLSKEYKSNYSENYFLTLSAINTFIQKNVETTNIFLKSNVLNLFIPNSEPKWDTDFIEVLKSDPQNDDEFLKKVEIYAKNKNNVILLSSINSPLGVKWDILINSDSYSIALALLHRYGKEKRKNTSDLFNDIVSGKLPFIKKIESLLFLYGFHYGYSQFRNKEIINNNQVTIKYLMNSQLDYYTIESIFQNTFRNKNDSDEFYYLTKWCPKYNIQNTIVINKKTKFILDVPIYGIATSQESLIEKIKNNLISFFLENEQSKYGEKIYTLIKNEVSNKLDSFLKEVNDLENENTIFRQQQNDLKNNLELLNRQISNLEKEKVYNEDKYYQILKENKNLQLTINALNHKELDNKKRDDQTHTSKQVKKEKRTNNQSIAQQDIIEKNENSNIDSLSQKEIGKILIAKKEKGNKKKNDNDLKLL